MIDLIIFASSDMSWQECIVSCVAILGGFYYLVKVTV